MNYQQRKAIVDRLEVSNWRWKPVEDTDQLVYLMPWGSVEFVEASFRIKMRIQLYDKENVYERECTPDFGRYSILAVEYAFTTGEIPWVDQILFGALKDLGVDP